MKSLLSISFKNVVKSRERAILTFLILTFGTLCYVDMSLMLDGLLGASLGETRTEETSDIRIRSASYDEEKPTSEDNLFVANDLPLNEAGYMSTPRLLLAAEADNYQDSIPVVLIGIDPKKDPEIFKLKKSNEEPLAEGTVWVGSSLAADLGLGEGDYVNLSFRTLEGAYISGEYSVGALISSANPLYGENGVLVDIGEIQNLIHSNVVSYYSIQLAEGKGLETEAQKLKGLYPDREVLTWEQLTKEARDAILVRKQFMGIFLVLILLITLVGLMNTILISVWEKRKTTGTLRALGYSDREIILLFVFEGAWIGFIGALIGVALGLLLNIPMATIGFRLGEVMKVEGQSMNVGFNVPPVIRSTWSLGALIVPMLFVPIASMLTSIYPARKSVKMSVVDCLRNKD